LLFFISGAGIKAQLRVHGGGLLSLKDDAYVFVYDEATETYDVNINTLGTIEFDDEGDLNVEGGWYHSGTLTPANGTVTFLGSADHDLNINIDNGITFSNIHLNGADLFLLGNVGTKRDVFVNDELNFLSQNVINGRGTDTRVVINDGGIVTQTAEGYVDGFLSKWVNAGAGSYFYEVGIGSVYTPASFSYIGTGGTAGQVEVASFDKVIDVPDFIDNNDRISYYWQAKPYSGGSTFDLAVRTVNTKFEFPSSEMSNLAINGGVYYLSLMARYDLDLLTWEERGYWDIVYDDLIATAELNSTATMWPGLGDFHIGDRSYRIFYSMPAGGNWEDNTSWTFNPNHVGPIVPSGIWPTQGGTINDDIVEIGILDDSNPGHDITTRTSFTATTFTLDQITIQGNSSLDLFDNTLNNIMVANFKFYNTASLIIGGENSLCDALAGWGRYEYGEQTITIFDGDNQLLNDTPTGVTDGLDLGVDIGLGNVIAREAGTKYVDNELLVRGNFTNETGSTVDISNCPDGTLKVLKNVINAGAIVNASVIEIGQ
jgi:hypothetical protein